MEITLRPQIGDDAPFARLLWGESSLNALKKLPDGSVHTVITEPPSLRLGPPGLPEKWPAFKFEALPHSNLFHKGKAAEVPLGDEDYPEEYVGHLVQVFREVARVLRPDGTLWLYIRDKHNRKQLMLLPHRVALALQAEGWVLRNEIVWHMENPTPDSASDRFTVDHNTLLFFAHPKAAEKGQTYFFDADSTREPHRSQDEKHIRGYNKELEVADGYARRPKLEAAWHPKGRKKRTTWTVNLGGYLGKALAPWPADLVSLMVKSSIPAGGVCRACGTPLVRAEDPNHSDDLWWPSCDCNQGVTRGTVLDPFAGTATTGKVALDLGANFIGLDNDLRVLPEAQARIEGLKQSRKLLREGEGDMVQELFGNK